jgi:hypothetical protein
MCVNVCCMLHLKPTISKVIISLMLHFYLLQCGSAMYTQHCIFSNNFLANIVFILFTNVCLYHSWALFYVEIEVKDIGIYSLRSFEGFFYTLFTCLHFSLPMFFLASLLHLQASPFTPS